MPRPVRTRSVRRPKAERPAGYWRDRLAALVALITVVWLGWTFVLSRDTRFLMPGPLTNAHGAIENCSACHTKSGSGKLSWLHGLVAGDPVADSRSCLTCHRMPDTAFYAHGASAEVLERSTERLTKVATRRAVPPSARAQSIAFPTDSMVAHGLYCATCHQEHQGAKFKLNKISNEQCHSCHVAKFDSFEGHHPEFENYPFKRRTRIIYDHAGHFGKHFPEMAKRYPAKRIPATCSTCHSSHTDRRVMAVAPFEQTCAACHLDHITGKERVSGPKGIAFLTLPGLDLQTLKKKKAPIGEWPEASEADLTPFMKVMISRNERGRVLIEAVKGLNLQDLSAASDDQINAVTYLVWEIKRLFYALITGKASDVLAELNIGGGAKLSANLVADLTASIPRDVVTSAHQQWLPNLGTEMAKRKDTASVAKLSRLAKANQQKLAKSASSAAPAKAAATELEGKADAAGPKPDAGKKAVAEERPQKKAADQTDDLLHPTEEELRGIAAPTRGAGKAAQPEATARKAETAKAGPDNVVSADAARADANAPADTAVDSDAAVAKPQARAAPPIGLKTDVDPETWAEYGGWYRQDYAIFYRPAAHKDKFIYSWLLLAGPQAPKGGTRPAAAVFDFLTSKDAQGACTKCHSVDDVPGKGRLVNFSPPSVGSKQGRFTNFVHEPHFGVLENRGCLTCHQLEKGRPYLQSYEQGNPKTFVSSFGAVKKELCQTCHTSGLARQDCLLCHKYHVNGVIAPIMSTKIPTE